MAIAMLMELTGATPEQYDALNREMDLTQQTLPDGLVSHVAARSDDGLVIFDVWESREAFDRFVQERVMPAAQKVLGPDAPQMQPRLLEIHNEFHGRVH